MHGQSSPANRVGKTGRLLSRRPFVYFPIWIFPIWKPEQHQPIVRKSNSACPDSAKRSRIRPCKDMSTCGLEHPVILRNTLSYQKRVFRIAVCIRIFHVAEWYEELGRDGLCCPEAKLVEGYPDAATTTNKRKDNDNGGSPQLANAEEDEGTCDCWAFSAYVMCQEERIEFSRRATDMRIRGREFTSRLLNPSLVGLIEMMASQSRESTLLAKAICDNTSAIEFYNEHRKPPTNELNRMYPAVDNFARVAA
jgi:hypothetical protein